MVDAVAGTITRYYYDDQRVLLETDYDSGTQTETDVRYFVYGNYIDEVLVMADIDGGAVNTITDGDYTFAHDHLYSPAALFDEDGTVVERYEYDAYGKATVYTNMGDWDSGTPSTQAASAVGNPYLFTGRRLDALDGGNLNLMYYRARTYDPETGRFMQRDPLSYIDSMNSYEYVMDNPLIYFDALGLWSADTYDPRDVEIRRTEEYENHRVTVAFSSIRKQISIEHELFGEWGNWEIKVDRIVGSSKFRNGLRREWIDGKGCVFVFYTGTATPYVRYRERINTIIHTSLRLEDDWGDRMVRRLLDVMSTAPVVGIVATITSAIIDENGTPNTRLNWMDSIGERTEAEGERFWDYKNFTDSEIINSDPHKKCPEACPTEWIGKPPTIRLYDGKDYPLIWPEFLNK